MFDRIRYVITDTVIEAGKRVKVSTRLWSRLLHTHFQTKFDRVQVRKSTEYPDSSSTARRTFDDQSLWSQLLPCVSDTKWTSTIPSWPISDTENTYKPSVTSKTQNHFPIFSTIRNNVVTLIFNVHVFSVNIILLLCKCVPFQHFIIIWYSLIH